MRHLPNTSSKKLSMDDVFKSNFAICLLVKRGELLLLPLLFGLISLVTMFLLGDSNHVNTSKSSGFGGLLLLGNEELTTKND